MKLLARIALVLSLFAACYLAPSPALAATCSGGANCTTCKNCSACVACSKRGGTCSVYRPDKYHDASSTPARRASPHKVLVPIDATVKPKAAVKPAPKSTPKPVPAPTAAAAAPIIPEEFTARCVGVIDGDTLKVLLESRQTKQEIEIRLYGIDAPESKQAYGTQAKKVLSDLAFGKDLKVFSQGRDRYGRLLAWLFHGNTVINEVLVRVGAAWWYQEYAPKETRLEELQSEAKSMRLGLWRDEKAMAPWAWRELRAKPINLDASRIPLPF